MKDLHIFNTFLEVSKKLGSCVPSLIQGPGGNVSVKEADQLLIKSSGWRLSQVSQENGYVSLNRPMLLKKFENLILSPTDNEALYSTILKRFSAPGPAGTKNIPSMETGFHALLPKKWVLHFHSLASILMFYHRHKNAQDFEAWFNTVNNDLLTWVQPCVPGWDLAQQVSKHPQCDIFMLRNHGIILQTDDNPLERGSLFSRWLEIESLFCKKWGYAGILSAGQKNVSPPILNAPWRHYFPDSVVFEDNIKRILHYDEMVDRYTLIQELADAHRDSAEIFTAISLLYNSCPDLEEISPELCGIIKNLPLEIARRAKQFVEDTH